MDVSSPDRITALLTDFLDVQSRRAQVVASNLANADTPGFAAQELDFAEHLKRAAQAAVSGSPAQPENQAPMPLIHTLRVVEQTGAAGLDGNTVDVGREMSTLADTGMRYLAGTQMLQSRLRTLRAAIREGR
jgi:flagellar basal-body rod protein FlgB